MTTGTRRRMRLLAIATAVALSGALAGGCTHEQVLWPPTAEDVARMNGAIDAGGWYRVNYVQSLPAAAPARVARPTRILWANADTIAFRPPFDHSEEVPANLVTGVTVKTRGRGTLIGLGIGAVAVAGELGVWYALRRAAYPGTCVADACSGEAMIEIGLTTLVTGAVLGYFLGSRRTFHFAGGPASTDDGR
jgi:hypothetical protein